MMRGEVADGRKMLNSPPFPPYNCLYQEESNPGIVCQASSLHEFERQL
jgi:hypothetical protein